MSAFVNKVTLIRADSTSNGDYYGVISELGSGGQFSSIVCKETSGIASASCGSVSRETVKRRLPISDVSPGNVTLSPASWCPRATGWVELFWSMSEISFGSNQKSLSSNLSSEGLFCALVYGYTKF